MHPLTIKVHTFVIIVMILPEKIYERGVINNTLLTTDHGTHYRCKFVIEWKPSMFFIWWSLQEIRHMNTTCNALKKGIRIADYATVSESCMGISNNRIGCIGSSSLEISSIRAPWSESLSLNIEENICVCVRLPPYKLS